MVSTEGRDPYFYLDLTTLFEVFTAEDYPFIEIEYMIPATNQLDTYSCELFLCTGNVWDAMSGISVGADLGAADGQYRTLRIDLSQSGFWSGDIHKVRIDFFNASEAGDLMFIKSVSLKTK